MNRNALIKHVELWKNKLGSLSAVAKVCDISDATLSTILAGKYGANEAKMLTRIASALNYRESSWQIVRSIGNYKRIYKAYMDAKEEKMWFIISNKAGSGKTETLEDIFNRDETGSIVLIQAEEWTGRQFLMKLIEKTMGAGVLKGKYKTITEMVELIANHFLEMMDDSPVLFIDEADKLRPAAFRQLIPLFNRTKNRLGLIMAGTENLEKEIKAGVRLAKKGFDEIESRCGRTYIHLNGLTKGELKEICNENGIESGIVQERIWNEIEKVKKPTPVRAVNGSEKEILIEYTEDFRRLERLIKREKLIQKEITA